MSMSKAMSYILINTLHFNRASEYFFSAFLRTDDAFLIRFLRAREFDIFSAFRLYSRYFEFRQNHDSLFQQFEASEPGMISSVRTIHM